MPEPNLRIKIFGARGSYSPTTGDASTVGVNTTCFRIDIGQNVLIFDAGSGIINCGNDLIEESREKKPPPTHFKIHLFFTHMHIDHLVGFPYFPMLYMPASQIHFLSPRIFDYTLEGALKTLVHPPFFPLGLDDLPFKREFHEITGNKKVYFFQDHFEIRDAEEVIEKEWQGVITCIRNYTHPQGGSFFYRIESSQGHAVVLASDTEGFIGGDQRLIKFAKDADILLHDAQYTPEEYGSYQGFGHSTYQMACEVAKKAGVKKLLLIHHDPRYGDQKLGEMELEARKIFSHSFMASESMEFVF